jgi:enterochelin esterase family protein
VIDVTYPTPSIGGARHALVVLPIGYDSSRANYPVVEMLHGSPGVPSDVIVGFDPLSLAARPDIPAYIGVVPDGHGPVVLNGEFADTSKQRLGAAVSIDLRRWVDRNFRTNKHWGVMGLSAGGYGAAYLASRNPPQFDAVCSLSGNFTPQGAAFRSEHQRVLNLASPILHVRRNGPPTLLVTGSSDRGSLRESFHYARALQRARQPFQRVVVPGGHDWGMWKREFPRCLRYMLTQRTPGSSTNLRHQGQVHSHQ